MKLKHTIGATLLIAALALAGCGGAEEQTAEQPAAAAQQARADKDGSAMAEGGGDAMAAEPMTDTTAMDKDADAMAAEPMTDTMAMDKDADAMAAEPMTDTMAMDKDADAMATDHMTATTAMDKDADAMAAEPMTDTMAMDNEQGAAVPLPAWITAQLTDVNTGQPFTIADYKGKVILVETLAVWCSNCMRQQNQVKALHEALGERDDYVSVGLDIDLNESPEQLKNHAQRNGFDWVYAVATPEVAREISQLYGTQFLNPPSTPMLIIDRQGEAHPLPFGIKSAEDLQSALEPFLAEEM